MDFLSNTMTIGTNMATEVTKRFVFGITNSNRDRIETAIKWSKNPKAELYFALLISQALIIYYAKRPCCHRIVVDEKNARIATDDRRAALRLVNWLPACYGMLVTASVCFDLIFHFKVEKSDQNRRRDDCICPSLLRSLFKSLSERMND